MSTPAVRIGAGLGVAVRAEGLIAWFVPPPAVEPALLVRALVLAAGTAPGLPEEQLETLARSTPGLALAVVSLGEEFGRAWVCGEAVVTIDGPDDRRQVAAQPGKTATWTFPLPRYAVRLGDVGVADTWSHLIAGAVPSGGVAVVWDPSVHPQMPVRPPATAHGPDAGSPPVLAHVAGPRAATGPGASAGADSAAASPTGADGVPAFEAISLLTNEPVAGIAPLPLAGDEPDKDEGAAPVEVAGLRCANGHFNHPHAANCAWCGLGMIQVSHIMVREPRPALGVLVVDGQATFTLDSDYVLGRQPHVWPEVDGRRMREIVLSADRAISRAHAAIRLVDWDVVVVDLDSGIGTWVQQPGQRPFQLPPRQPTPLAPGAVVHVGPHRFTYHSHFLR
ncbi:MAG: FHA domain-containing protein [Propionibacteriaceae bacterium]|nr:FHA domain-containing protein [Propionibacteriaceae bacterium]